jgi:hypothetical protein
MRSDEVQHWACSEELNLSENINVLSTCVFGRIKALVCLEDQFNQI